MYTRKGQYICKKSRQNFSRIPFKTTSHPSEMKMDVFRSLEEELSDGNPEKMEKTAMKVRSMPNRRLFDIEKVKRYAKGKA